ncbi:MAG: glycosyltransferase family 10 [Leptothrix sp. (in: b-proteobacteria)]
MPSGLAHGVQPALRKASLVVQRERGNRLFQPGAGPNGGDFFLPWRELRAGFARAGYELNTPDLNAGEPVAFELHLNAQRHVPVRAAPGTPCYSYLYEDPLVRPLNADRARLRQYRKIWSWDETLIDAEHIAELEYPNDLRWRPVPDWAGRDLVCVMLASNKAFRYPDARNLHAQRLAVIRAYEAHAPNEFQLFGRGWQIPAVQPGAWGRLVKRLHEWRYQADAPWAPLLARRAPFPSWRGAIGHKREVLDRARFAICYENSRGNPGYITEKIFDCLTSGCVPVYIGTQHARPPIPADCYIDGDALLDPRALIAALQAIDAERFARYQQAMRAFLQSDEAQRYSNAHWCRTLVDGICSDLLMQSPTPTQAQASSQLPSQPTSAAGQS